MESMASRRKIRRNVMNKLVVFGSTGMLGYAVSEYFDRNGYDVKKNARSEFDIANDSHEKLYEIIGDAKYVVNCAGVIKPRIKDNTIENVLTINSAFPKNLAKVCRTLDVKCIHVTTDCVYTGNKGKYSESDVFDADDLYGLSKNGGDSAECMVLRTSIIGEENGQSRSLLEWAKSQAGKEVNGFTNHLWNGVTTTYLAEIIDTIFTKDLYKVGLFHIHSPNTLDKYELLKIFDEVYNLQLTINAVEGPFACDRSMISNFNLSKGIATKTIEQQVEEMKMFFINREKKVEANLEV
jgi:dTDP-4-dehydrorhamnose reductase